MELENENIENQEPEELEQTKSVGGNEQLFREVIHEARRSKFKNKVEKLKEKVAAPAKAASAGALRWAWQMFLPSWGLSIIYVNIHVFLRAVLGDKLFCKLGEEWIPKQISSLGGEAGKFFNKSIGFVEAMGLFLLDVLFLLIILIICAVFFMLIDLTTGWFGWLI